MTASALSPPSLSFLKVLTPEYLVDAFGVGNATRREYWPSITMVCHCSSAAMSFCDLAKYSVPQVMLSPRIRSDGPEFGVNGVEIPAPIVSAEMTATVRARTSDLFFMNAKNNRWTTEFQCLVLSQYTGLALAQNA